jgi:tripartite-type tricarboxylate transporter receptor subunit TctC
MTAALAMRMRAVAESGYPDFEVGFYQALLAPAGVPEPIRVVLDREVRNALQSAEVQARLRANAMEPFIRSGAEMAVLLKSAAERWRSVITSANIQID